MFTTSIEYVCSITGSGLLSRPPCRPADKKSQVEEVEEIEDPSTTPTLAVKVSTSFPSSEIFGIKLVNGQPTQALLSITNDEPEPVTVVFIGGSLWTIAFDAKEPHILRNLTTTRYKTEIPAGAKESISYSFTTELLPRDLRLNLAAVITDTEGTAYTLQAFNETVSVVEPDTSLFDPQMSVMSYVSKTRIWLTALQHFSVSFPPCGVWGHLLFHLYYMDQHTLPPKAPRW